MSYPVPVTGLVHITPFKGMLQPIIEPSCGDSPNEGSQHMFLLINKRNYL